MLVITHDTLAVYKLTIIKPDVTQAQKHSKNSNFIVHYLNKCKNTTYFKFKTK
jgi:hypothetical protein